ncbi:diacylglycerol kinase [Proteiniborus sp. MB09-C3]|uniref:diacylglycerol kinase n=1 Tax=Proteiniborus sp. MB09-C3 TaxID=3050072 RepID=UPI00255490B3|nr:diacylglycerol kinase [Proteiniborus sp. MB09-C3]WIV10696.1 diacylglycerol kinase [Proteiniborus sp. MB09-C3]
MKVRKLIDSFNYAVSGIIYTLKTQRNMRIHYAAAILVLFLSLFLNFTRIELLLLFFTISLVIIAEMINTAIEKTIDMYTKDYHPLAEIAKNVAAGSVLIAAINAIIVAYLLFFDRINPLAEKMIFKIGNSNIHMTFISIILVIILTIVIKAKTNTGTPFKGGTISGHSSIAFSAATAILFISKNFFLGSLGFLIAFLVAESRIENKIHTFIEVFAGALLGILITVLIFKFIG